MKTICGNGCGNTVNQVIPQITCDDNKWPIQVLSKNGQEFYPLTHTKAVIHNDCQTLDEAFKIIDAKLNTQILDINVNVLDDVPVSLSLDDDGVCRLNTEWIASQNKAIKLISSEPSLNNIVVSMDRQYVVPKLSESSRTIVNALYWVFVYDGYEYVIDSACHAEVRKLNESSSTTMDEVVRQDIDENHQLHNERLHVTPFGKAVMPLVTDQDSGLISAEDYRKLKELIGILDSYDAENHTIVINNITYQLTPWSDKFKWNNNQNWNDNNNWQ